VKPSNNSSGDVNKLFPVFLKLENLPVLIVGGGTIALEKLNAILENSPQTEIRLVALIISEAVKKLAADHPNIQLKEKIFSETDLDGIHIVIIAINDPVISQQIRDKAKQNGKLVNVADKPDMCDFYMSSIIRKGNLKIAISTNGKSPTIARRLKEVFSEMLPDELEAVLNNMQQIRNKLSGDFSSKVRTLNTITESLVEKNDETQ
jgi:uncharacterized protein